MQTPRELALQQARDGTFGERVQDLFIDPDADLVVQAILLEFLYMDPEEQLKFRQAIQAEQAKRKSRPQSCNL